MDYDGLQVSQGLTLCELLSAANKTKMCLFSRGCKEDAARVFLKVLDEKNHMNRNANPQYLITRFRMESDGPIAKQGALHMTNALLAKLCEDNGLKIDFFMRRELY